MSACFEHSLGDVDVHKAIFMALDLTDAEIEGDAQGAARFVHELTILADLPTKRFIELPGAFGHHAAALQVSASVATVY